jgi:hypothetical protein
MVSYPSRAIFVEFFLPDWNYLLDTVNSILTSLEGFESVGRTDSYNYGSLPYFKPPNTVNNSYIY